MNLTLIGDVHGKVERYKEIVEKCDFSICVGDFGFKRTWDNIFLYFESQQNAGEHWINMGNHDCIPYVISYPSCGDFKYFAELNLFTVRGADSIDKHLRTEGLDWFANEELNYLEQLRAFDEYIKVKPKIVVSHDCPQSVMEQLFGYSDKSQTRVMLEYMFQEHQPDLWVFGHHHKSKDVQIDGTRFVCLDELEKMEIVL